VQVVADYNANEEVHGILVQLPLPKHIDEQRILDAISLEKDVDGFHPANIGALAMRGRTPLFTSCTPKVNLHFVPDLLLAVAAEKTY
jgi:5,10-methylene-tetrahydrofolate dehydrogenase/methenyl tetrahydrofolate cyclohydrolase